MLVGFSVQEHTERSSMRLPEVGEQFAGRYQILAELGRGGMSAVYKAEDRLANEILALKVVQPEVAEKPKLLEKFKKELALARRMAHPNVVRIHDIGESGGLLYISMELIDGVTVAERLLRRGKFSIADFWPVFRQFCEALSYIHSRQVVHRDIKPLNVMIDRAGNVKLMDFGISRDLATDKTIGILMGTPAYMAPEVLAGKPASPASDVYSAGVLFYEMLTAKKPVVGRTVVLPPGVPAALAQAIQRCLDPESSRRPASVAEIVSLAQPAGPGAAAPEEPKGPAGTFQDLIQVPPSAPGAVIPAFVALLTILEERRVSARPVVAISPERLIYTDGVVRVQEQPDETAEDLAVSTPKYTAPEAFQTTTVDNQRANLYVVGFLLYECLIGRSKFEAEFGEVTGTEGDLGWLHWHGDPSRAARPLKEILDGSPPFLSQTIARMLEKRPDQRMQTYQEAINALQRVVPPPTVVIPPTQTVEPLKEPTVRASPKWVGVAAVAFAGLIAAAGLWWVAANRARLFDFTEANKLWQQARGWIAAFREKDSEKKEPEKKEPEKKDAGKKELGKKESGKKEQEREKPLPARIETATGTMILIPAGPFTMGRDRGAAGEALTERFPREQPAHRVEVAAFYLDKFEVTNSDYDKFCQVTGNPKPRPLPTESVPWAPGYSAKATSPVVGVSWNAAAAFCQWAQKRLPSEAEWEKAARGDKDERIFPWGNQAQPGYANWRLTKVVPEPAPGGARPRDRSPYGVMDLSGNLPEWVDDSFSMYPGSQASMPPDAAGTKVVRGGAVFYFFVTPPGVEKKYGGYGTVTNRDFNSPARDGFSPFGFRCAADAAGGATIELKP